MRTAGLRALAAIAVLAAPATASAATPDLQVVSVQPSRDSVPAGIATPVTFVVNVRNDGEATTGRSGSIGPVGGAGTFKTTALQASNFDQDSDEPQYCDAPGGDSPRCHMQFLQRGQTQQFTFTETVTAPAVGTVTRTFTADVVAPDTEGNGANNAMAVVLQAVPGALPAVSKVAVRGRSSVPAKQRKRAVGLLKLTLNRDADLALVVERRGASGKYRGWGKWTREGNAGANTIVLSNRIDYFHDPPINFVLRRMVAGIYRMTIVATDGDGHQSKPVKRVFVVPRGR